MNIDQKMLKIKTLQAKISDDIRDAGDQTDTFKNGMYDGIEAVIAILEDRGNNCKFYNEEI